MDSKSKNAILWTAIERFSVQGIQFILGLIIARILTPDDYGLIAMLSIFTAIAQSFVDSGFGSALIQKQNRTNIDYSTVFYFNFLVSILCYLILYFSSHAISVFYNEPDLELITKVVGINLIINSLSLVQRTKLIIELKYSAIAKITLIATVIGGGIGLLMAYWGFGVWTLIFQTLILNIVTVVLLSIYSKWIPMFVFSISSFKSLFTFGSKLLLGGLMHTVYTNLYSLVIGKKFEANELGLFNRSYSLAIIIPSNITSIMERTFYPIGCEIQNDNEKLKLYFIKNIRLASFVLFPIMLLLGALAKPIIIILLSEKWIDVSRYLPIMCVAYMWDVIMRLNWNILSIKGRTDLSLKSEVFKKIVSILILIITIPFGLKIMCYGLILYSILDILIITIFTKKLGVVTFVDEIRNIFPFLAASILAVIPVYYISTYYTNNYLVVFLGGFSTIIIYCCILFFIRNNEILSLLNNLKNKITI